MTNPRKKTEALSETTKAFLQEIYIEEFYNRKKFISSPAMEKGTIVESLSLDLVQKVTGKTYFKNNKQIENDYVIGTPDVTEPLIDIKSSWDLWTFSSVDEKKGESDYYYQLLGYAWILEVDSATLSYCLVNTPDGIIGDELQKIAYRIGEEESMKYKNNYVFDDIPEEKRLKSYVFEIPQEDIEKVKQRIIDCREYLATMEL